MIPIWVQNELGNLTAEQVEAIHGFGAKTSGPISEALQTRWPTISHMKSLGFILETTPLASEQEALQASQSHPFAGKTLMFNQNMFLIKKTDLDQKNPEKISNNFLE